MGLADCAPDYVRTITPYQPGKPISELARELGLAEAGIIKLASNENPLGMSPLGRQAMLDAAGDVARYPDGGGFALKSALCRRFGVQMNQIVLGNGSNDVLDMAARVFLGPGRSAVYAQYAFSVYPIATLTVGARGIEVPAIGFGHDLDGMRAAIAPHTRVVFIANPNNPTGTFVSGAALERFLAQVPADVLVVLDEAYNEYLEPDVRYDSVSWLARHPNLVISRTFSKIYGLAGLRVGYAFAHPGVADLMNRVRQPFNVGSLGLAAAEAALADDDFIFRSFELNRLGMKQLVSGFERLGIDYIPSYGNFVTFVAGDAPAVNDCLLREGIIVRPIGGYGMPKHLRVSIGLEHENARFLAALERALGI